MRIWSFFDLTLPSDSSSAPPGELPTAHHLASTSSQASPRRRVGPSLPFHDKTATRRWPPLALPPSAALPPLEVSSDEEPLEGAVDYGGVAKVGGGATAAGSGGGSIAASGGIVASSGGGGWGDFW